MLLVILLGAVVNGVIPFERSIAEINEMHNVHHLLYQGDILLTPEHAEQIARATNGGDREEGQRMKRQASAFKKMPSKLWLEGVNYHFATSIKDNIRNAFAKAAKLWESNTCINFTENPSANARVRVFSGQGCYSYVGKLKERGEQLMSLGYNCATLDIVAHEIGHTLGFIHTHSRHDRDNFIKVKTENIAVNS
ncbi:astacin, partial [Ostertagia ostertagi]